MEKKTVPSTTVIKYSMETSLKTFHQDIESIPREIEEKVKELGLDIAGPHTWVYFGANGDPDKRFILDITIPVKEAKGDGGKFRFEQLPEFECVVTTHKGPWNELGKTYEKFVPEILKDGNQMSGFSREVYHVVDLENQKNCVTEIQIGIN